MRKLTHKLRTTIVRGVLFIAPFVVLIIIFGKALELISVVVLPVAEKTPVQTFFGMETPVIFAVIVLLFICFLSGLFAQTRLARKMVGWLEAALLSYLPGYSFMKDLGEEAVETKHEVKYKAVIVQFDDAEQIGFLIERISERRVVVFLPNAPIPWTGQVFIFSEDRVKPLVVPSTSVLKCLQKIGEGTGEIVKGTQ